jgi:prepilin signal peptidase PulO-like enzyme (type II secretory pathway)
MRTRKCGQNSSVRNTMWSCVLTSATGCTTQNWIFEDCLALHWGKWNAKHKYCNSTITSRVPAVLLLENSTKLAFLVVLYAWKLFIRVIIWYVLLSMIEEKWP